MIHQEEEDREQSISDILKILPQDLIALAVKVLARIPGGEKAQKEVAWEIRDVWTTPGGGDMREACRLKILEIAQRATARDVSPRAHTWREWPARQIARRRQQRRAMARRC